RILDAATHKPVSAVKFGSEDLGLLQFSPDGGWLVTSGYDGGEDLRLWTVATGRPYRTLVTANPDGQHMVRAVAFAPHLRTVATLSDVGLVTLWELADGTVRRRLPGLESAIVTSLAFTVDGRGLVLGTSGGELIFVDLMTGTMLDRRPGHRGGVSA